MATLLTRLRPPLLRTAIKAPISQNFNIMLEDLTGQHMTLMLGNRPVYKASVSFESLKETCRDLEILSFWSKLAKFFGGKSKPKAKTSTKKQSCKKKKSQTKKDTCMKKSSTCDKPKVKKDPTADCKSQKKETPSKKDCSGDKKEKMKEDPCKKKEDPCKKKEDPCKKKEDPCKKKEDPCKKKDDPCKKKEDPCKKKEDPCKKKEEPCKKKEDPCKKKEDPCKKKEDPCKKSEDPCKKKEDPCKKKEDPCKKKDDPCKKKEDPCKKKEDPCKKSDDPCKKKEDPCKKSEDPCKKKDDPCKKKEDPCKKSEDPCKKKEDPCKKKEDPCKKSEDPCKKKEDPCKKKEDPCKKKEDPCKKSEDPCKKKEDPCKKKEDPCKKDDPCKKKEDPCSNFIPLGPIYNASFSFFSQPTGSSSKEGNEREKPCRDPCAPGRCDQLPGHGEPCSTSVSWKVKVHPCRRKPELQSHKPIATSECIVDAKSEDTKLEPDNGCLTQNPCGKKVCPNRCQVKRKTKFSKLEAKHSIKRAFESFSFDQGDFIKASAVSFASPKNPFQQSRAIPATTPKPKNNPTKTVKEPPQRVAGIFNKIKEIMYGPSTTESEKAQTPAKNPSIKPVQRQLFEPAGCLAIGSMENQEWSNLTTLASNESFILFQQDMRDDFEKCEDSKPPCPDNLPGLPCPRKVEACKPASEDLWSDIDAHWGYEKFPFKSDVVKDNRLDEVSLTPDDPFANDKL